MNNNKTEQFNGNMSSFPPENTTRTNTKLLVTTNKTKEK
jgi:hypothetical protein